MLPPGSSSLEPGRDLSWLRHPSSAERAGKGVSVAQGGQGLIGVMGPPFKAPLDVSDLFLSLKPSHPSLQPPHFILHSACVPFSLTPVPSALDPLCLVGGDGHGGPELCLAFPSHLLGLCYTPLCMPSLSPSLFPSVMVSCTSFFHPPFLPLPVHAQVCS